MFKCKFIAVLVLLLLLHAHSGVSAPKNCLQKCTCSFSRRADVARERINCSKIGNSSSASVHARISVGNILDLSQLPSSSFNLILKDNWISIIKKNDFKHAGMLQKLDLSRNEIIIIEAESFKNLSLLKKLDLSRNEIRILHSSMFKGLSRLERLDLGSNSIFNIAEGTFTFLTKLKAIALDANPLICDCHFSWFPPWALRNSVRPLPKSFCRYPIALKKTSLRVLNETSMICEKPIVPNFRLNPSEQQLVFEGDTITLTCKATSVNGVSIYWTQEDVNGNVVDFNSLPDRITAQNSTGFVDVFNDDFELEISSIPEKAILVNSLTVNELSGNHSGLWSCHANSKQGEVVRSVQLTVVTMKTVYCPEVITTGRKGTYIWPKTIAPNTLKLKCIGHKESILNPKMLQAQYSCAKDGSWYNLDSSQCPFVSEVTKILQQFAEVDESLLSSIPEMSVLIRAKGLRNYTVENYALLNDIDVNLIAVTVKRYLASISQYSELDQILLDIIDNVLKVAPAILSSSDLEFHSCSIFINAIDGIPNFLPETQGLSYLGNNVAVERFLIKPMEFVEMTCMSTYHDKNLTETKRSISCNVFNLSTSLQFFNNPLVLIQAAFQFPATVLKPGKEVNAEPLMPFPSHLFQLTIFTDGRFFPVHGIYNYNVTSVVLSIKFANFSLNGAMREPVTIMLKTSSAATDSPAWWNSSALEGLGEWTTDGCKVIKRMEMHVLFSCRHLSHFALIQNTVTVTGWLEKDDKVDMLLCFAVYIGSFICITCLMIAMFLYMAFHSEIKMPAKAKHSLVNTWLSILILMLIFNLGIKLTFHVQICQSIGLLINYLSLCVLLWIVVTLCNVYTKLYKPQMDFDSDSEDGFDQPVPKKPMIRFYMVGWGIPVIVCGISAAVNWHMYASRHMCTLPFYQSIGAVYSPAAIFTVIALGVYLRVRCLLPRNESDDKLVKLPIDSNQEGNSTLENDADEIIVEEQQEYMLQKEYEDSDEGEIDEEHSYAYQSAAQIFVLLLYLLAWSSAAVYIAKPKLEVFDPYQEVIFSGAYCFFATVLGLFVFMFHCYFRNDVRRCMCKMLQIKRSDPMRSQQQSDITITTTVTQTTETTPLNDSRMTNKSASPLPLERVEINAPSSNHGDTLTKSDSSRRSNDQPFIHSEMLSPKMIISNSHAGPLNRDSSNSISSVALTDRSRYTYHTLKSMNGLRSASPQTCIGFVHPMANSAVKIDVNYYNPQQQQIARKFFQRQREKRRRLNLKNLCKSESSRDEDTVLNSSINTSLTIPKQITDDNQVPNAQNGEAVTSEVVPMVEDLAKEVPPKKISPVNGLNSSELHPNGHILPSPACRSPTKLLESSSTYIDPDRTCCSPASMVSLSRRSVQSENIGKKRHKRRHRDSKTRASSQSVVSNGSNSYPLRTHREKRKKPSKMSRSISAYEQINNNNRDSTSSDDDGKRVSRKPRNRQKHKNSLKKETSV